MMRKILETLAGGMAAMLFAAIASAQVNPPVTNGAPLRPIQPPPPPVRLPPAAQQPVPVATPPVATRTVPQQDAPVAAAPAQAQDGGTAVRAAPVRQDFADITHGLLALQASGRIAGKPLLMQEPVAEAGFQRYMKSFQLNLPQWFGERVRTDGAGGGMSGGQ